MGVYGGGYGDYLRQRPAAPGIGAKAAPRTVEAPSRKPPRTSPQQRLSYKDKRELESLPGQIEALEEEQQTLEARVSEADFYRGDKATITDTLKRLEQLQEALGTAYERWEYLDGIEG